MPSVSTPARVRFPRSSIAGRVPDFLAPGSPAYNWPDRKIYVGDPGGVPLLFSHLIRDWQLNSAYETGDLIVHEGELLIATRPVAASLNFDPDDWQPLTSNAVARFSEVMPSGVLSGGAVTITSPTSVTIAAGTGVITNVTVPGDPTFIFVEWAGFTATVTIPLAPARLLACIDASGDFLTVDSLTLQPDTRRSLIVLGTVRTDGSGITLAGGSPLISGTMTETYRDELLAGRVAGWRIAGATLIPGPGSDLHIAITAGLVFSPGENFHETPENPNIFEFAGAVLNLDTYDRDGVQIVPDDNLVKVGVWDDAGSVEPVPVDQFTIQFLTIDAIGATAAAQLGQQLYASTADAVTHLSLAYEEYEIAARQSGRIVFGALVVRGDATDLSDTTQALLIPALLGRTSPFVYLPPVGEAVDLTPYYQRSGALPLTGPMDAGGFLIDNAILDGGTF